MGIKAYTNRKGNTHGEYQCPHCKARWIVNNNYWVITSKSGCSDCNNLLYNKAADVHEWAVKDGDYKDWTEQF